MAACWNHVAPTPMLDALYFYDELAVCIRDLVDSSRGRKRDLRVSKSPWVALDQ